MVYMIFTDGASRGNPGEAGGGFAIYENKKEIIAKGLYYGEKTNNQAEYMAVINAVQYIKENNLSKESLMFFSDSQFLVKQMKGEYKVKAKNIIPLFHFLKQEIKDLKITFQWIPREDNKKADEMANKGIDEKETIEKYDFDESKVSIPKPMNLIIDKAFFGKVNCLKIQMNDQKEVYFHMGIEKNKVWTWNKVKMSSNELGEIVGLLRKEIGKCSFYHSFEKSSTQIWCNKSENSFSIKVKDISKNLSIGEFEVLRIILEQAIIKKEISY